MPAHGRHAGCCSGCRPYKHPFLEPSNLQIGPFVALRAAKSANDTLPQEAQEPLAIQRHNLVVLTCISRFLVPNVPATSEGMRVNTDIQQAASPFCGKVQPVSGPAPPDSLLWGADGQPIAP